MEPASDTRASEPRFDADRPPDLHRATPGHRYREHIRGLRSLLEALARDMNVAPGARILDYGTGVSPYRDLFPATAEYVAADLPGNPRATLVLNPDGTLPVQDESFDAVFSTQVLEHVPDPALYLSEACRVLRPGGRLLLSTHGTFPYHPDPDDYWRWTCAGLRRVIGDAGLHIVRFEGMLGLLPTGLQLVQDAIYWHLPRMIRPAFAWVMQGLIALGDRLHSDESRLLNAQVYGVVAEKP